MKKPILTLLTLLFLLAFGHHSHAQSNCNPVPIEDAKLRAYLKEAYPQVLNSKLELLPCEAAKVTGEMDCRARELTSVDELQYFTGITKLDLTENSISSLSKLPPKLETLYSGSNPLAGESIKLNDGLKIWHCGYCTLGALPALPASITELNLNEAQVAALPSVLPSNLRYMDCAYNGLASLPALPASMEHLACSYNSLTALPALPPKLKILMCSNNKLAKLPTLPESLETLKCGKNQLTCLPNLPAKMTYLDSGFGKTVCGQ